MEIALLNIENGFIEPRDRVRFNTNFPIWKKKRIRLLKWEDPMTLKVRIQGNKRPVRLGITHFLFECEIEPYLEFTRSLACL